jgi:hypothetical protein
MFLAIGIPSLLIVFGYFMNNRRFDALEKQVADVKTFLQHFIDLHINHEGRISKLEERTK